MSEETPKNLNQPNPSATGGAAKPKRSASPLQRVLEHGLSFSILAPAIGGFLVLLLTLAALVADEGAAAGIAKALALSGSFWAAGYVVGLLPSLITGLLVHPLWRRSGNGWLLYATITAINCLLCGVAGFFMLGRTLAGLPMVGLIAALATLACLFLTRKLREE